MPQRCGRCFRREKEQQQGLLQMANFAARNAHRRGLKQEHDRWAGRLRAAPHGRTEPAPAYLLVGRSFSLLSSPPLFVSCLTTLRTLLEQRAAAERALIEKQTWAQSKATDADAVVVVRAMQVATGM
jgi:hypothetical protein